LFSILKADLDVLIMLAESDEVAYEQAIVNKLTEIQSAQDSILLINHTIWQRGTANAQVLKTEVAGLAEPFAFCSKHKQTLNASLDLVLQDKSYVASQYGSALKAIAEDCEFDVGNAVFNARALCNQLGISFDEGIHCIENRSRNLDRGNKTSNFVVYPNPSSSELNIANAMPFNKLTVFGIDGKLQLAYDKNDFVTNATIDISILKSGIYIIEIVDKNYDRHQSKFIKI
jgi:hypothetical protein